MTRVLMFRAFNKYGIGEPFNLKEETEHGPTDGEVRWPEGTIFMQFTGLLDTLDDPIYEGDRLFHKGKEWEVQFNQDYAGYCLVRHLVTHGENESIRFDCDVACESEVIGNIYESEQK